MRIGSYWRISLFCFAGLAFAEEPTPSAVVVPGPTVELKGTLLEKGTRNPLAGVNVFILPHKLKATTDDKGEFTIKDVPAGAFQWVVNASNYDRFEKNDEQTAGSPAEPRVFYLKRASYEVYETTVYGQADKRELRKRTLSPREFTKAPGSFGDPLKAVQNLPGVARPSPLTARVSIEGSAPQDTKYLLDGHEIPLIFHFGGLTSVVFPETLERVDFLASGYGPENSRALGGIIGAGTRAGRTDKFHGLVFADLTQAGALFEVPIGRGSLSFGGRRSYVGDVLKLVAGSNSNFDLAVAPSYGDLIAVYDTPVGNSDKLRIVGIGSKDALKFLFDSPVGKDANGRGAFSNDTNFYRFIPQWTSKHSEDLTTRVSMGAGQDFIRLDVLDNFFELKQTSVSLRGEAEYKFSPWLTSILGTDNRFSSPSYSFRLPETGSTGPGSGPGGGGSGGQGILGNGTKVATVATADSTELGFFLRNQIEVAGTPFTLLPSLRVDHYTVVKETVVAPRLAARFALDDYTTLRSSVGLYSQTPQPQQTDPTIGSGELKAEKSWHWTLGMEKDFRAGASRGFILSTDLFYKTMHSLVVASQDYVTRNGSLVPERFNNTGAGKAFGLSTSVKYDAQPWTASLSYTLSRSTRFSPDRGENLFNNDQTHVLVALAQVDLGNDWSIGSRLRFVSGNPFTPVTGGVFSSDADRYLRLRGPFFSRRLDAFFALDVRVDKKWIYDTWILSAYLDIQNLTNRGNVEQVSYSYDFARTANVTGLPIFPTLGFKGEF